MFWRQSMSAVVCKYTNRRWHAFPQLSNFKPIFFLFNKMILMITWKGFATAPFYFLCCLLICRHTSHESSWQPRDHGHDKTRHTPLLSIRDTIHNQSYSPWLIDDGFLRTLVRRDPSEFTKCHSRSVWEYPSAVTFHWMSTPRRASTGHTPRMTQVNQQTRLLGATCGGRRVVRVLPSSPSTHLDKSLSWWIIYPTNPFSFLK